MESIQTIVTHPGGAHKDDLLATCVLIAEHGCSVARREPTAEELNDPRVAVVDIGGSHDPDKRNFDHHHFPREHAPTCALSLVLDAMGLYQDALGLCDWLEPAEWFDSRGPKKTAEWLGVPRQAISQLNSPIDMTLLRRFASQPEHQPGETLYEYMRFVGQDLLEYLRVARERIAFVASHVARWSIQTDTHSIGVLFLPRTEPPVDEPSNSLKGYIRTAKLENDIAVMVYPDRRGEGYGIGRYEDDPRVDFSVVQQHPQVHFAHKSGFMCKTSATDEADLREIIVQATSAVP